MSKIVQVSTQYVSADGVKIFYREAGPKDAPVLLLLHGYPTSSHQYRHLIPALADKYRVISPDYPGFGFTEVPAERNYVYTFDNLAKTTEAFVDALGLKKFGIYIFDYGAPVGFRLALSRPESIIAIITQNGNAFVEGLGDFWNPLRKYWSDISLRESIRPATRSHKNQYVIGESEWEKIAPETWTLDDSLVARPGNEDIQLDLFYDYQNNITLYPVWQQYLKQYQPPLLAIWGKNDIIFIPPGAEAFKQLLPKAKVVFIDGGHFVLENHLDEAVKEIKEFLADARV